MSAEALATITAMTIAEVENLIGDVIPTSKNSFPSTRMLKKKQEYAFSSIVGIISTMADSMAAIPKSDMACRPTCRSSTLPGRLACLLGSFEFHLIVFACVAPALLPPALLRT